MPKKVSRTSAAPETGQLQSYTQPLADLSWSRRADCVVSCCGAVDVDLALLDVSVIDDGDIGM